jgi:uncharacterized protein (TIGR03118 family)
MNNSKQTNACRKNNQFPFLLIALLALTAGCKKSTVDKEDLRDFKLISLVSNVSKYHPIHMDTTLKNAWGLAWAPSGIPWVNSNGGGVSDVYSPDGVMLRPPVNIPTSTDSTGGAVSGIVFAGGKGFRLKNGNPAAFLFVSEDGILAGWNGKSGNNAQLIKDLSPTAKFKGLAIANLGSNTFIYATDFKANRIVVWDTSFMMKSFPFHDPGIPSGYAPFNIQAVGSWLYVTYAKVGPTFDDVKGAGFGFVDIFGADGSFVSRFASHGPLNAPWGITAAGEAFLDANDLDEAEDNINTDNPDLGDHGGDVSKGIKAIKTALRDSAILIGNFGDGMINAYSLHGKFLGHLASNKQAIVIDGLWAIGFAPSTSTVGKSRLYFTAGPDKETNGLFGYLVK